MTTTNHSKPNLAVEKRSTAMQSWRLIPPLAAPGPIQMAIDRWLLEQHFSGCQPPVLRFYTWSPVAISLGYHQRHYPPAWQSLIWQGAPIELVRRPSGGRAVLHQGDLTYTVVTSGVAGDRMQAYQTICQFLIQGWRQLGVELSYGAAGRGYIHNPNCFGTATAADLVTPDGTKLIGSAQLRRGSAVLQHGSMRLYPDLQLFEQVFGAVIQPPQLPLNFSEERAIATLSAAASQCFAAELHTEPLSATEWQAIQEFIKPAVLQQNPPKSE